MTDMIGTMMRVCMNVAMEIIHPHPLQCLMISMRDVFLPFLPILTTCVMAVALLLLGECETKGFCDFWGEDWLEIWIFDLSAFWFTVFFSGKS